MEAAIHLKRKLDSGAIVTGMLATNHFWPGMVELVMDAGHDYLIIDLEHFTHDAESVAAGCAIGRRANFAVFVRPPAAEYVPLRLAMDLGPCGLLIPCVESLETMQLIQDAVWMKPRGRRRPGGPGNSWVKDFHYETWKQTVEDHLIILPQIENRIGLRSAREIASHPLTTALAVGPYDLSADLGACWHPDSPEMQQALGEIRAAADAAGKRQWMIGHGPDLVRRGYTFLCLGEPTAALGAKLAELNQSAHQASESVDEGDRSRDDFIP